MITSRAHVFLRNHEEATEFVMRLRAATSHISNESLSICTRYDKQTQNLSYEVCLTEEHNNWLKEYKTKLPFSFGDVIKFLYFNSICPLPSNTPSFLTQNKAKKETFIQHIKNWLTIRQADVMILDTVQNEHAQYPVLFSNKEEAEAFLKKQAAVIKNSQSKTELFILNDICFYAVWFSVSELNDLVQYLERVKPSQYQVSAEEQLNRSLTSWLEEEAHQKEIEKYIQEWKQSHSSQFEVSCRIVRNLNDNTYNCLVYSSEKKIENSGKALEEKEEKQVDILTLDVLCALMGDILRSKKHLLYRTLHHWSSALKNTVYEQDACAIILKRQDEYAIDFSDAESVQSFNATLFNKLKITPKEIKSIPWKNNDKIKGFRIILTPQEMEKLFQDEEFQSPTSNIEKLNLFFLSQLLFQPQACSMEETQMVALERHIHQWIDNPKKKKELEERIHIWLKSNSSFFSKDPVYSLQILPYGQGRINYPLEFLDEKKANLFIEMLALVNIRSNASPEKLKAVRPAVVNGKPVHRVYLTEYDLKTLIPFLLSDGIEKTKINSSKSSNIPAPMVVAPPSISEEIKFFEESVKKWIYSSKKPQKKTGAILIEQLPAEKERIPDYRIIFDNTSEAALFVEALKNELNLEKQVKKIAVLDRENTKEIEKEFVILTAVELKALIESERFYFSSTLPAKIALFFLSLSLSAASSLRTPTVVPANSVGLFAAGSSNSSASSSSAVVVPVSAAFKR